MHIIVAALYPTVPHTLVDNGHRQRGTAIGGEVGSWGLHTAYPFDLDALERPGGLHTIYDKA